MPLASNFFWVEKNNAATGARDRRFVTLQNALAGHEGIINRSFAELVEACDGNTEAISEILMGQAGIGTVFNFKSPVVTPPDGNYPGAVLVSMALPAMEAVVLPENYTVTKAHPLDSNEWVDPFSLSDLPHRLDLTTRALVSSYYPSVALSGPGLEQRLYLWGMDLGGSLETPVLLYSIQDGAGNAVELEIKYPAIPSTNWTIGLRFRTALGAITSLTDYGIFAQAGFSRKKIEFQIDGPNVRFILDGVNQVTGDTDPDGWIDYTGPNGGVAFLGPHYWAVVQGGSDAATKVVKVSNYAEFADSDIKYEVDGTTPTLDSTPYAGPFSVATPVAVRARIVHPDAISGSDTFRILLPPTTATPPGVEVYQGTIAVASDFPTIAAVVLGYTWTVTANVTDNDVTKTNTGQSFLAGQTIFWNGVNWTWLGAGGAGVYKANRLPVETPNGVLATFTVPGGDTYVSGSLLVALNGLIYQPSSIQEQSGLTQFRIINGDIIPSATDSFTVSYARA